jgi:two-component system NtrC family sensor kinase
MTSPHILIVADTVEAGEHLQAILQQAGYTITVADESAEPPACDILLADVTRLRGSPLVELKAQRRLKSDAPALLLAPRLTGEMASQVFSLGVRHFVSKPIDDAELLAEVARFVEGIQDERRQGQISQELRKAQAALARRANELGTLSRIGRALATLTDVDTMLARIVEAAVYLTRAEEGAIFLVSQGTGTLELRAEKGFGEKRAAAIRRPSSDSTAAHVLKTGEAIMRGAEATPEERKLKTGYLPQSLVSVPIIIKGKAFGVLAVYHQAGGPNFEPADQETLVSLADYAAITLDKFRVITELEQRVDEAMETSRKTLQFAEKLLSPVEAVESQADTLLSGQLGELNAKQHDAVNRIRLAMRHMEEVIGFIEQMVEQFQQAPK